MALGHLLPLDLGTEAEEKQGFPTEPLLSKAKPGKNYQNMAAVLILGLGLEC
jgi:hypothetical protein